jgi:MFS family permease
MPEVHDPLAALRQRDYRCLLAGSVLASVASQVQSTAVGWELYLRTESALPLGLVGLAQFLPVFLLALPAGHVADRHDRKRLLIAAQGLLAACSLGLAALSYFQGPVPLVYLCLLLVGISRAFSAPARWALLPQVVPEKALGNAITWNSSGWQLASVAGPWLGGLVIATGGRIAWAYLLSALCLLVCVGLLLPIRPRPRQRQHESLSLDSFLAGVRFVWSTKPILATITLDLFAVFFGGATALLPMFAKDILQVGAIGLGYLRAAPALGAVVMAVFLALRPPLRHAGPTLLAAVAGFGLAWVAFGLSTNVYLSFVLLALTGALDNISVVVRGTLVQVLSPDAMRGRVSAVNTIFIVSSNDLGDFESGLTARFLGPVVSVVGGGIGTLLVVLAVMLRWPEVLRLGRLEAPKEAVAEDAEDAVARSEQSPPPHG